MITHLNPEMMATKKERMIEGFMNKPNAKMVENGIHKIITYDHHTDFAVAYYGNYRGFKPQIHFKFPSEKLRAEYIAENITKQIGRDIEMEKRYEIERNKRKDQMVVGAILYASWGYEQTNIDFFQITYRSGTKVTLQKIGGEVIEMQYGDRGTVMPDPSNKLGEPFNRRITKSGYVRIDSVSSAAIFEGSPMYFSSYA